MPLNHVLLLDVYHQEAECSCFGVLETNSTGYRHRLHNAFVYDSLYLCALVVLPFTHIPVSIWSKAPKTFQCQSSCFEATLIKEQTT